VRPDIADHITAAGFVLHLGEVSFVTDLATVS
jgi:hypothetical protein